MANLFAPIEGAQAILSQGGYEQQVPVYHRNDLVYAKVGNKYVRLLAGGTTAVTKMLCLAMDLTEAPNDLHIGCTGTGSLAINGAINADQTARMFKTKSGPLQIIAPGGQKLLTGG